MTKLEEKFLAVLRLDDHFGYEADTYGPYGYSIDYYCRGPHCSQPLGKPHLDNCPVGAFEEEADR